MTKEKKPAPEKEAPEASKPKPKAKPKAKPAPKLPQKVEHQPDPAAAFIYRGLTQLLGVVVNSENVKSISYSLTQDQVTLSLNIHTVRLTPDQLKLLGYDAKGFAVWLTSKGAKRAIKSSGNSQRKV